MKKLQALLLLALSFVAGCQTNKVADVIATDSGVVLSVSLAPTRVSLGNKVGDTYSVCWNEGDRLVANAEQSEAASIDPTDRSMATFKFSEATTLIYPLHITYPYSASTTAENPKVDFLAEQRYVEGSFEAGSAPLCGYVSSNAGNITLNHLAAILHLPVKAEFDGVVLDKVVITSNNKIAGTFDVDCQNATVAATEGCVNVVTYNLPANFTLSSTSSRDLFVVLPAVEVGTCKIEFVESSGEKMVATWSPNEPLSRGVVREFKTITYLSKSSIVLPPMGEEKDELMLPLQKYAGEDEIKIMSFNVRVDTTESDSANNWKNRKAACVAAIRDHQPTIIGFQEAKYTSQWLYLKEQLADSYDGYGVNRDTGEESGNGEVMGILYNTSVVEKIEGGTFWLSETPDVPSKGFGANYSRNATWGLFKHKPSGKIFYYINTHLDHQVANAQIEGMKLISQHFEVYKDTHPLFLTGDLNIGAANVAIDVIESYMYNTREAAPEWLTDYNTTYNGYVTNKKSIIDHIYCSNNLKVVEYHTINEQYCNAKFISDHYPVYAIVKLE